MRLFSTGKCSVNREHIRVHGSVKISGMEIECGTTDLGEDESIRITKEPSDLMWWNWLELDGGYLAAPSDSKAPFASLP